MSMINYVQSHHEITAQWHKHSYYVHLVLDTNSGHVAIYVCHDSWGNPKKYSCHSENICEFGDISEDYKVLISESVRGKIEDVVQNMLYLAPIRLDSYQSRTRAEKAINVASTGIAGSLFELNANFPHISAVDSACKNAEQISKYLEKEKLENSDMAVSFQEMLHNLKDFLYLLRKDKTKDVTPLTND